MCLSTNKKNELCSNPCKIYTSVSLCPTPYAVQTISSAPLYTFYRNVVDLSMSAHKGGALTTTTNPAYEMTKQGGQGSHEYELVGVSPGTAPPIAKAADKTYEMPSPPSHQPLPAIPLSVAPPTGGDVGVAKEGEEEGVYDNIPGDQ